MDLILSNLSEFPDGTTALGKHGAESAPQEPWRRPRGGKKPLRLRQQQLGMLEAELEHKMRELKAAQAEHERLQQRIKVLEIVLPVREHQVQLLKLRRQAANGAPPAHIYTHDSAQRGANGQRVTVLRTASSSGAFASSSPGSEVGQSPGETLEISEQPEAAAATYHLPAALICAIKGPADQGKADSYADALTSGRIALFTSVPARSSVPCHVLQHVVCLWKQWMLEAGLVLHVYDARPHDPGPQLKLAQLYEQLAPTFCSLRLDHPSLLTELMYVNLETGEREEPPPENYWIPVAQGLRLSTEQVADAKAALALYNERTAKALGERRRLAAELDARLAALQGKGQLHGSGGSGTGKVGQLSLEVDEMAGQLYRNVMDQGDVLEVLKDFMGSRLFSLVQMVRAGVLSYPYFPDVIAILSSLDATAPCPPASNRDAIRTPTSSHGLHGFPAR